MEHAPVRRVEREDPRVALALAEEVHEAHQLDQELVLRQARRAGRELVRGRLELRLRGRVERVRVDAADLLHQQAHVVGRAGRGRRGPLRRAAGDDKCRCQNREKAPIACG